MSKSMFQVLAWLQVPRFFRYLNRNKILIVTYHGFTRETSFPGIENSQGMHLNIQRFRKHLAYLRAHYRVVPLEHVVEHYLSERRGEKKLPKYAAVITMDDGYRSTYTLAYPALKEAGLPAILFLATDFVGKREPLWHDRVEYALNATQQPRIDWTVEGAEVTLPAATRQDKLASVRLARNTLKAVRQEAVKVAVEALEAGAGAQLSLEPAQANGLCQPVAWQEAVEMAQGRLVSLGSHTKSHVIVARCSPDTAQEELQGSKDAIEQETGQGCQLFCYPNGAVGDFDGHTREQLRQAGYTCGLTTVPGLNDKRSDVLALRRLSGAGDLAEFSVTVSGLRMFVSSVRALPGRLLGAKRPAPDTGVGM